MATIDGARAVGLEEEIGSIEVGKKADMVVLDYNNAFMTPIHHPVSAIVYSALGNEVTSVMIDGRFVMRDGVVGRRERNGGAAPGADQRRRSHPARRLRFRQEAAVAWTVTADPRLRSG